MERTTKVAPAAERAATRTTLAIGAVEVAVGLFPAVAKPAALAEFETAGPNGGRLKYEQRAQPKSGPGGGGLVEMLAGPAEQGGGDGRADPFADDVAAVAEEPHPVAAAHGDTERRLPPSDSAAGEFRQVLVEEGSGVEVERDQVRRGVRVEDGRFVDCTAQLAEIDARTRLDRFEVVAFIDIGQVPRERVLASYYVAPSEPEGKRALRLLYEAMRSTRRAAVAKWTTRTRQACGVVVPFEHRASRQVALMVLKLAWAEDMRAVPPAAALNDVVVADTIDGRGRMLGAAEELVRAWSDRRVALDELRDDAIALREELMARVVAGEMDPLVVGPEPEAEPMPDLQAALEASVEAARS